MQEEEIGATWNSKKSGKSLQEEEMGKLQVMLRGRILPEEEMGELQVK